MTELDLYRFIKENDVEISWYGDDQLTAWLCHYQLMMFCELIGDGILDEGGIEVRLQQRGTIALNLVPICEYHGIDPERILPKTD